VLTLNLFPSYTRNVMGTHAHCTHDQCLDEKQRRPCIRNNNSEYVHYKRRRCNSVCASTFKLRSNYLIQRFPTSFIRKTFVGAWMFCGIPIFSKINECLVPNINIIYRLITNNKEWHRYGIINVTRSIGRLLANDCR